MKRTICLLIVIGLAGVAMPGSAQDKPAAAPAAAPAQPAAPALTINLKDGKTVTASSLRRLGENVMATVPFTRQAGATGPASSTATVELGYPVSSIAKIDFPEPPQLKAATDMLAHGKAAEALGEIQPIVTYYSPFKDVPGAWWTQAAVLKLNALVALGREADAESLISELSHASNDPEAILTARVQLAANWVRKGQTDKAAPIFDQAIKDSHNPQTLAVAWLNKGVILAERKDWDGALLAYLHVPVFYPEQKLLMPQALLGSARAFVGMEDLPDAERTYNELIASFPASPEAATAKTELHKAGSSESTEKEG